MPGYPSDYLTLEILLPTVNFLLPRAIWFVQLLSPDTSMKLFKLWIPSYSLLFCVIRSPESPVHGAYKYNSGVVCLKQISRTWTSNYTPQNLWNVITCPRPWYLLLVHHSSFLTNILVLPLYPVRAHSGGSIRECTNFRTFGGSTKLGGLVSWNPAQTLDECLDQWNNGSSVYNKVIIGSSNTEPSWYTRRTWIKMHEMKYGAVIRNILAGLSIQPKI